MKRSVRKFIKELEQQNPIEEPAHQQEQVSTTDADATYATEGGTPARLDYYDNYLVDNHSCVIVGVQATAARMSQETVAAQHMIARSPNGKDGSPCWWAPMPPTGTASFRSGYWSGASLPICALGTMP